MEHYAHGTIEFSSLVESADLKEIIQVVLEKVPIGFWSKPASSTGKYHSPQSNGEGGLVRHTKAVCIIAKKLCEVYSLTPRETDLALTACILHDCCKYGLQDNKHTTKDHAVVAKVFVERVCKMYEIPLQEDISKMLKAIHFHQGKWTHEYNLTFPEKFDKIGQVVHLADVISSIPDIHFYSLEEKLLY